MLNKKQKHLQPLLLNAIIACSIIILTVTAYIDVRHHQFLNFDDNEYVYDNNHVTTGLSPENIGWAFTFTNISYWHPLSWLSHMLDCQLFGLSPGSHHLISMGFHLLNALLLFLILLKMTGAPLKSAAVSVIFAIHPVNVESVAWVTERKTLLSTIFFLGAVYSYIYYTDQKKAWAYVLSFFMFALGLLSKPSILVFPLLLLILDFWPLERYRVMSDHELKKSEWSISNWYQIIITHLFRKTNIGLLILEKIPFAILAIVSSIISMASMSKQNIVINYDLIPLDLRFYNLFISILKYIWFFFWPVKLSIFYPFPKTVELWQLLLSIAAILIITVFAFKERKQRPWIGAGWLWFLVALAPASGIIQAGLWPEMANRFIYIPMIGIIITIIWELDTRIRGSYSRTLKTILGIVSLVFFLSLTRVQNIYFSNSYSLFMRAKEITTNNFVAYNNIGDALCTLGRIDEAADYFKKANEINTRYDEALYNYGLCMAKKGDYTKAILYFSKAINISPRFVPPYVNLAIVQYHIGNITAAENILYKALQIDGNNANSHNNLGIILADKGKIEEAIRHYLLALSINPNHIQAKLNLTQTYEKTGRYDKALVGYKALIKMKPKDKGVTYYRIAGMKSLQNKFEECRYYLDASTRQGFDALTHVKSDDRFDPFRETAIYTQLLAKQAIKTR